MALSESIEYDRIEVVGQVIQVRKATVIKKDGKELSRSFHRYSLVHGMKDPIGNYMPTDISSEPAEVQAICNAVWTPDAINTWKASLP
tara:strand:+ start:1027 stop:1290 length:264 start_codon:yes stop_codon:yes gene_type:complete